MSDDIPPEGSVERPYHQNPPRVLREVHWGGLAVHFFEGAGPPLPPPSLRRQ